jgi:hypothetical protein
MTHDKKNMVFAFQPKNLKCFHKKLQWYYLHRLVYLTKIQENFLFHIKRTARLLPTLPKAPGEEVSALRFISLRPVLMQVHSDVENSVYGVNLKV